MERIEVVSKYFSIPKEEIKQYNDYFKIKDKIYIVLLEKEVEKRIKEYLKTEIENILDSYNIEGNLRKYFNIENFISDNYSLDIISQIYDDYCIKDKKYYIFETNINEFNE